MHHLNYCKDCTHMNISKMIKNTQKIVGDNAPVILTAIGVAGTLTTAVLTGKAAYKAANVIRDEERAMRLDPEINEDLLTPRERFDMTYKLYLPAVATGALSVTCIIGANRIGTRRAAAMAAAYTLSEKAVGEYREKVVEKIGATKEAKIREDLIQARVNEDDFEETGIIQTGKGTSICKDELSGRYFYSSKEVLDRAVNDINYQILDSDYATVSDFYDHLGLEHTSMSGDLGWNTTKKMDCTFFPVLSPSGKPVLAFEFTVVPIRNPWRFQ